MSTEHDARMARENALGAMNAIQEAERRILEKLDGLAWDVQNQPKDLMLREAIKLVSQDMHTASNRPCPTCQVMTNVLGEPFGCLAFALRRQPKAQPANPGPTTA